LLRFTWLHRGYGFCCVRHRTLLRALLTVPAPSDLHIRNAVKDCLARCFTGDTPLGVIAEFVLQLRESGWSDRDIRAVEVSVRRVMAGIVTADEADYGEEKREP